jgi:hypothetical protein
MDDVVKYSIFFFVFDCHRNDFLMCSVELIVWLRCVNPLMGV